MSDQNRGMVQVLFVDGLSFYARPPFTSSYVEVLITRPHGNFLCYPYMPVCDCHYQAEYNPALALRHTLKQWRGVPLEKNTEGDGLTT